ncbi:sulfite exporter TauE/SafE family protein [Marivibrio halodurans]|uniref:Probable membrane transporter protein n=1 Tax=Marivibrio halodurans TaxID=2039722 RepID=A0A8J7RX53_9PROT|nr:sulfite exporter TauE/SafE family protein [Marivibrio halodurans]MBP5856367.1 sulfite exporter TauE/SafE family protein [Marivibrio halodurans]
MDILFLSVMAGGALVAGFVSGLTGLGTGLISLSIWIHVASPTFVVPLGATIAVAAHITTLTFVRHGIHWPRLLPFLAGGVIGMPIGVFLLPVLDREAVKLGLGIFLVAYAAYGLLVRVPPVVRWGGRAADAAVGVGGGFFGGLLSLSGPLPTIWAGLRGWPKDEQRGVYQPFNLMVLLTAAIGHYASGRVALSDAWLVAMVTGLAVIGAIGGLWLYRRASSAQFRRYVLVMLAVAGLSLVGDRLSALLSF